MSFCLKYINKEFLIFVANFVKMHSFNEVSMKKNEKTEHLLNMNLLLG